MICSSNTTSSIRRWLSGALILAALATVPALGGEPRLDGVRRQATAALERRDPIAAEVTLREAIRQGVPADALRAQLAQALLARNERRDARKVLGEGGFTPDTAELGWRIKGQLELAEGNLGAAAQAFDQALKIDPQDSDLWVQIASMRFTAGEQALSIEAAEQAVQLGPRNPRALALRGMLIREQFGLAAALPWFEAALGVLPDDPALLGEYAATLGDMGKYRDMLVVCRKLALVDPKNPRPLFQQAVLAARAGKTDLARAILLRTGSAFRDMPAAILLNGILEYRAGNTNLAVEQFDRLVRLQPDNLQARALLARALARQGDWRQLAQRFDSDAQSTFTRPYLKMLVGQAWVHLGQKARGQALIAAAGKAVPVPYAPIRADAPLAVLALRYDDAPNFASNAVPYIRALLAAGQGAEAQGVADRLRDANPGAAEANLLSGDVRMMRGDAAHALVDYSNGAAIRFNEPVLWRMDAALRALGRTADADSMTSRYLLQNPNSVPAMKLLAASWTQGPRQSAGQTVRAALRARGIPVSGPSR